ncbi:hypothetical protein ACFV16_20655 [Streptomyces massasporeus]|uniref:hypothetical protein n=1 Tax=Streptomyces massasporeus TaxID=67324 RepID=UPI0036C21D98
MGSAGRDESVDRSGGPACGGRSDACDREDDDSGSDDDCDCDCDHGDDARDDGDGDCDNGDCDGEVGGDNGDGRLTRAPANPSLPASTTSPATRPSRSPTTPGT